MENIPLKVTLTLYGLRNQIRKWLQPMRFRLLNLRIGIEVKTRSFFHSLDPVRARLGQVEKELETRLESFRETYQGMTEVEDDDPEVQSLLALIAEIETLRSLIQGGSIHYYNP